MTFYLLLIIPHVLALGGLFAIAMQTRDGQSGGEEDHGLGGGGGGGTPTPEGPRTQPPRGGMPLPGGGPPSRRLRVGETLAELYPRRLRRGHDRPVPAPRPAKR